MNMQCKFDIVRDTTKRDRKKKKKEMWNKIVDATKRWRKTNDVSKNNVTITLMGNGLWNLKWPRNCLLLWLIC